MAGSTEKTRILIGIPSAGYITPETVQSVYNMDTGSLEVDMKCVRGYTADNRNVLAKFAVEGGYSHLMFVDSDVVVPKDALEALLAVDAPVVLGYYYHRYSDGRPLEKTNICPVDGDGYMTQYTADELRMLRILQEAGETSVLIRGGGVGCALIETSVFEKLEKPWFKWVRYKSGKQLSEDLFFCEKCRDNNIPIYAALDVACGHNIWQIAQP